MPDPFGLPFGNPLNTPAPTSELPQLTPTEQESLLSKLGGGALHGLGWVGGTLSKAFGGRAIRGALGMLQGRDVPTSELLSWLPGSDTFGLTDPGNEVHGSDLLGGNKDTSFFSPEGIGGLGVDILTDPATYLTFGGSALTPLGKAATKISGVLPKTVAGRLAGVSGEAADLLGKQVGKSAAEVAGQRLGGHFGFHIPFTDIGTTFDLSGPLGLASKVPGVTKAGELLSKVTDPIGRALHAGFNPEVMGQMSAKGQEIAPKFYEASKAGKEAGRLEAAELMRVHGAADMRADPQGLRNLIETVPSAAPSAGAQAAAPEAKQYLESLLKERQFWGDSKQELGNYFPRQVVQPELDVAQDLLRARSGSRADVLLKKGADTINSMVADPVIGTSARTAADTREAAQHLITKYGVPRAEADDLAQFLHSLHPNRQKAGLFSRDAIHDYMAHASSGEARVRTLKELYPILATEAGPASSGSMAVKELVGKLGLSEEAGKRAFEALDAAGKLGTGPPGIRQSLFDAMHVPKETANALGAILSPEIVKEGEFTKLVKSLIDVPSNLFRGHVTQPFPGFHERNAASSLGWIQTVLTGSPKAALEGNQMMTDLMRGKAIQGISEWPAFKAMGKTDEEVSKHAANLLFAKGLTDRGHVADVLGHTAAPSLLEALPGMEPRRKVGLAAVPEYAKNWLPRSLEQANPLNMRGIGGLAESKFAPAAAGERLATVIEQTGRGGGALALMKQGFDPDMAAAMTKAAHVDYTNLTTFEREVMRRLVPFYGWARGNIPFQLREVMGNPGGLTANTIKASARMEGQTPPEYLGDGTIANLGKTPEGMTSYLSGLGLPFEDLGRLTSINSFLGQLNPMLKFGLEEATGRQLHTGRELTSIHPIPGAEGVVPNWAQNLAANSPLARYLTTAKAATDDRGGVGGTALNLLTGARLSQFDAEKERKAQEIRQIEDLLKGNPAVRQFQQVYVPKDKIPQLTPQEMQLLRLYQQMRR